jgi:hypothetical protein
MLKWKCHHNRVKIDKGWIIQYGLVVANMPSRRGGGSAFLDVLVGLNKLFRGNCGGVSVDRDGYGRVRTSECKWFLGEDFATGGMSCLLVEAFVLLVSSPVYLRHLQAVLTQKGC